MNIKRLLTCICCFLLSTSFFILIYELFLVTSLTGYSAYFSDNLHDILISINSMEYPTFLISLFLMGFWIGYRLISYIPESIGYDLYQISVYLIFLIPAITGIFWSKIYENG